MRWLIIPRGLGRTLVCSGPLTLDVMDGGGFCSSLGVWRIGRCVLIVVKAGQA
jgi:hypothetical protein